MQQQTKTITTTIFKTTDGKIFEDKLSAENHELSLTFNERYKVKQLSLNDDRRFFVLDVLEITEEIKKELKSNYGEHHIWKGKIIVEQDYDQKWGDSYRFYSIEELLSEKEDDIKTLKELQNAK